MNIVALLCICALLIAGSEGRNPMRRYAATCGRLYRLKTHCDTKCPQGFVRIGRMMGCRQGSVCCLKLYRRPGRYNNAHRANNP